MAPPRVTYAGGTLTAYLDGEAIATAAKTLATTTTGELYAARAPARRDRRLRRARGLPAALDAATIASHFAPPACPRAADRVAPKPTIEAPAAGATTTTRPQLKGRLGELPGDVQHVYVQADQGRHAVSSARAHRRNGAW